jgi:threonine/homoserine/homoserine lactone efflux protein
MFETHILITYVAASVVIILAPGPAQALVLARSISDGKQSGVMTALGLNVGTIFHAVAAAFGLSAILASSAVAFTIVKYIGAGYLVYLGVKALLTRQPQITPTGAASVNSRQAFARAVVTGILNPKVAIFFLAFLPQFVDARRGLVFLQFLILGLILAALDILYESVLALIASAIGKWLTNNQAFARWRQKITGAVLVALGIRLALTERG